MFNNQQDVGFQSSNFGSVENALAGRVALSVSEVIKESWARTKGNKGTLWLALVIVVVVSVVINYLFKLLVGSFGIIIPDTPSFTAAYVFPSLLIMPIASALVTTPLTAGIWMLSLKIATDQSPEVGEVLKYFPRWLELFITYVMIYVLVLVGFCLFVLPGIYFMVAYFLALPLVVEKNMTPWQAMETSRKAINHVWFTVFGILLMFGVLSFLAIFTLGLAYIWFIPLIMIAYGVVYRTVFGLETTVRVEA